MKQKTRIRLIAAVAAVPVLVMSLSSSAQVRVNQDGRAHDANTRVGSDGANDRSNDIDRSGQTYTGNQLVTRNVTGNRSFRGPLGYTDPNEFRGPVAGLQTDRFVRDSAGAPTRTNPFADYGRATAYYGNARATPPPPGFQADGFSGSYFNTGVSQQTVGTLNPSFQSTAQVFTSQSSMLRPSGMLLDGGRDQQNRQTMLSVSPLYGVVPLTSGPVGDVNDSMLSRTDTRNPRSASDRLRLTPDELERMRQELNDAAVNGLRQKNPDDQAQQGEQPTDPANASTPLKSKSLDTRLTPSSLNGEPANATGDRLGADNQTSQGLTSRLMIPADKQSKQYAQLLDQFQRQQAAGQQLTPEEANAQRRVLQAAQEAGKEPSKDDQKKSAQPGATDNPKPRTILPPTRGGANIGSRKTPAPAAEKPAETVTPAPPPAPAPAVKHAAPIKIKSLAEGVDAKGLHDLLADAEKLMKDGKFTSAIEKYNAAEQVAPNNSMIRLGRAHAELGATRYNSAEQHLREALTSDPALLQGQYDLEAFLGRERLSFLVKDLKQVSSAEATSPRPKLLLAYIAYNTPGLESATSGYLDEASKLSKRPDPLIDAMKQNWAIESAPQAPELNK
jgi:hypothetical protein